MWGWRLIRNARVWSFLRGRQRARPVFWSLSAHQLKTKEQGLEDAWFAGSEMKKEPRRAIFRRARELGVGEREGVECQGGQGGMPASLICSGR